MIGNQQCKIMFTFFFCRISVVIRDVLAYKWNVHKGTNLTNDFVGVFVGFHSCLGIIGQYIAQPRRTNHRFVEHYFD